MITESEYSKIVDLAHRRKFAQFFTPEQIALFMSNWVLEGLSSDADVLEPAIGLGMKSLLFSFRTRSATSARTR